jgi:pimeloyl-ACP methyl ester carboxylesterase
MSAQITEKDAVLLGVSFGGMMGIEIARQIALKKLIIVSSIKSMDEMPRWMRAAGKLKLNKIIPVRSFKITERLDNNRLGATNEEEREMARAYRRSADSVYMEWAIDQILNWKNKWIPGNIVHIHGDSDRIFPIKQIKADYVLEGATHFMVYNRGKEVGEFILKEMQK